MAGRLEGKVAIVFGAGSSAGGLSNGMASAVLMAREGAQVFAVDRELDLMAETAGRIAADGGTCVLHRCDIGEKNEIAAAVAACAERFGRIDVLFNNVGLQAVGGPLEVSEEAFDRLMRVNVKGTYLTIQAVLPHMLRQGGGAIVNNSSLAAIRYSYPSIAYMTSKGAVQQLTQGVALQYAAKNIRCNAVLPGYIETERITARFKASHGENFRNKLREREEQVPAGRLGSPWDIGWAVVFLASDESRYVTGTSLVVDGGLSASTTGRISEA